MNNAINEVTVANCLLKALNNEKVMSQIIKLKNTNKIADFLFPTNRRRAKELAEYGINALFFDQSKSQLENDQAALKALYGQAQDSKVYTNSGFSMVNEALKTEYQDKTKNVTNPDEQARLKQKYLDLEHEILTDPIQTAAFLLNHQAKNNLATWFSQNGKADGIDVNKLKSFLKKQINELA